MNLIFQSLMRIVRRLSSLCNRRSIAVLVLAAGLDSAAWAERTDRDLQQALWSYENLSEGEKERARNQFAGMPFPAKEFVKLTTDQQARVSAAWSRLDGVGRYRLVFKWRSLFEEDTVGRYIASCQRATPLECGLKMALVAGVVGLMALPLIEATGRSPGALKALGLYGILVAAAGGLGYLGGRALDSGSVPSAGKSLSNFVDSLEASSSRTTAPSRAPAGVAARSPTAGAGAFAPPPVPVSSPVNQPGRADRSPSASDPEPISADDIIRTPTR